MSHHTDHATEAATIAVTAQVTKYGGLTSVVAWLADTGYVAILGLLIAALGLGINVYFQWRRDKRERHEHERRMWLMRTKPDHIEVSNEAD